jgi:hypothetical protein
VAFSNCPSLQSIDLPPSVDIDPELLLSCGARSILKKSERIAVDVPACITADWSNAFWSGYDQYFQDHAK